MLYLVADLDWFWSKPRPADVSGEPACCRGKHAIIGRVEIARRGNGPRRSYGVAGLGEGDGSRRSSSRARDRRRNGLDAVGTRPPGSQRKRHRLRRASEALRESGEIEPARAGRRASADAPIRATRWSAAQPLEIVELRMVLDPALARLAALRASPFEIARIQRAATTPAGANPGAADLAFHKAVAAGSRNSLAANSMPCCAMSRPMPGCASATETPLRVGPTASAGAMPSTRAIGEAIAARNPAAAERAMRAHLGAVQRQISTALSPKPAPPDLFRPRPDVREGEGRCEASTS